MGSQPDIDGFNALDPFERPLNLLLEAVVGFGGGADYLQIERNAAAGDFQLMHQAKGEDVFTEGRVDDFA
jgi:hypothetical protein